MKKIFLIDWNNFIYRNYFALPEFSTSDWKIVNALFGMAKFLTQTLFTLKPDYFVFIKDAKWENFRHQLYTEYKATRDKMPDNLRTQIPLIEEMLQKMNIILVEVEWCEADDVIATLATSLWKDQNNEIQILTWDKDLYSLVTNNVKINDTMKKKIFWIPETIEKFWIKPEEVIDYLGIVWDKSDNIPWIDGFWPQKALSLIKTFWNLENIYEEAEKFKKQEKLLEDYPKEIQAIFKWKMFEKLIESKENAFLSKKLATIKKDIELPNFNIENFILDKNKMFNEDLLNFFKEYEFNSLLFSTDPNIEVEIWQKTFKDIKLNPKIIDNDENLKLLEEKIKNYDEIVLDTETTSLSIIEAELVWISVLLDEDNIFYINRLHKWNSPKDESIKEFFKWLLDSNKRIIGHNIKYDLQIISLFLDSNNESNQKNTNSNSQISLDF